MRKKMKTDVELKSEGMELLRSQLGLVESERFIALLTRDVFDYTRWRKTQWNDATTVAEIKHRRTNS